MGKKHRATKEEYPVAKVLTDRNDEDFRYHYFPVGDKVLVVGNSDFSPVGTQMMKCIPLDEEHRSSGVFQNINKDHLEYI